MRQLSAAYPVSSGTLFCFVSGELPPVDSAFLFDNLLKKVKLNQPNEGDFFFSRLYREFVPADSITDQGQSCILTGPIQ